MNTDMNLSRLVIEQIREIDARDESQIMSELAGETVQEMYYTTEIYDRKLKKNVLKSKLSWAGTKEAARSRGNIIVDDTPFITDMEDSLRVVVRVTDLTKNFTIFGGCHQPKRMRINDVDPKTKQVIGYHLEDDPYYFQKGLSKAQRNAIQAIMPADFIAKCLDRFVKIASRQALKAAEEKPRIEQPTKAEIKARQSWESVTKEMVPDYPHLEKIFWDITKKQPAQMYEELGFASRNGANIPAWDAFMQLKDRFAEKEPEGELVNV